MTAELGRSELELAEIIERALIGIDAAAVVAEVDFTQEVAIVSFSVYCPTDGNSITPRQARLDDDVLVIVNDVDVAERGGDVETRPFNVVAVPHGEFTEVRAETTW